MTMGSVLYSATTWGAGQITVVDLVSPRRPGQYHVSRQHVSIIFSSIELIYAGNLVSLLLRRYQLIELPAINTFSRNAINILYTR